MLSKNNRLQKDKEIKSLIEKGQTFFLPQFVIKYQKNKENTPRFAFVISTKVDKRAVVRNRLKRQLREAIREFLPRITGFDVLVIVKKSALELDFATISKQMEFALTKIGLLKK
ncbi:ribonuclease P protein component [Candidatus Nomurabacteria bacterium]|nr:ribonuclease P protein component [Candidatus Nomurabacteria bacterium]